MFKKLALEKKISIMIFLLQVFLVIGIITIFLMKIDTNITTFFAGVSLVVIVFVEMFKNFINKELNSYVSTSSLNNDNLSKEISGEIQKQQEIMKNLSGASHRSRQRN
jgi:hypothetical protein